MTREDLLEELQTTLDRLDEFEKMEVYNQYCENTNGFDNEVYINDEEELDLVFEGQSPYYVLCRAYYGDYKLSDSYFMFDGYGNLSSFSSFDSSDSPFDSYEIADWAIDNDDDLGNGRIRDLLDIANEEGEDEDFEESLKRTRKPTRRVESIKRTRRNRQRRK